MKNYTNYFVTIFLIISLSSCQSKKHETELFAVELFDIDYEIINYYETKVRDYNGIDRKQIGLILKITNLEKLNILVNSIDPVIYLNINGHKYLAKGNFYYSSSVPDSDYFFPVDNYGKILVSENKKLSSEDNIIKFIGFSPRINQ